MKKNIVVLYYKLSLFVKLTIPSIVAVLLGIIFTGIIIKEVQTVQKNTTHLQKEIIPALEKATNNISMLKKISENLTFAVIVSEKGMIYEIKSNIFIEENLKEIMTLEFLKKEDVNEYLTSFKEYFKAAVEQSSKIISTSSVDLGNSVELASLLSLYNKVENDFLILKHEIDREIFLRTSVVKKTSTQIIYFVITFIFVFTAIMLLLSFTIYSDFNNRLRILREKLTQLDMKKSIKKDINLDELDILSSNIDKALKDFDKLEKEKFIIEEIARRDQLTKLYNRRYANTVFDKLINKKINYGLVLLDIDYFKKVNDTYGHKVGDEVLVKFAKVLKRETREGDVVARWGGEEFLIIIINTSLDAVFNIAQKIRKAIYNETFEKVGKVTASFGIALYHDGLFPDDIIELADKALYEAKKSGRNIVKMIR
jgi:diguanylate cyclase (GGDEF)-like protein